MPSPCSPPPGGGEGSGGGTQDGDTKASASYDTDARRPAAATLPGGQPEEAATSGASGELDGLPGGGKPGETTPDGQLPEATIRRADPPLRSLHADFSLKDQTGSTGGVGGGAGSSPAAFLSPRPRGSQQDTSKGVSPLPSVTSSEMYAALVAEMADGPQVGPVQAWCETVRHLFAEVYHAVPVRSEELPAERKRYPSLNAAEASILLGLFEQAHVKRRGSFSEWKNMAMAITRELLTTKWAFKEIVRRLASQHKWANSPVLSQWAQVVKTGATPPNLGSQRDKGTTPRFEDYMFDPSAFSEEDILRLRTLCAAAGAPTGQHQVREGTEDEWSVIAGLVEGTVACRRMPAFIRHVLKSEERLRLYSTIQAQVEGELILRLDRNRGIRVSRRTTKAIMESILESAELARVNPQALHLMLAQTKTISYDHVNKSIHFYFFTRTTADRHKEVRVPFYGGLYRLQNAHRPERGSIWQRQQGLNGVPHGRRVGYTVHLHNLTRFSDVGKIAAYLKEKIPTDFDMDDMDTHTPDSRTSTIWKVTFKLAGCPTFLDSVVRLLWFGTTIIIKHPNVGHRLQCLQCGNLTHTLARCSFTDAQLRGPGGIVVTEGEVRELDDLGKPFGSLSELKSMAAQRLQLQRTAEEVAQAAVTPAGITAATRLPPVSTPMTEISSAPQEEQGKKFEHIQPQPKPVEEQPWLSRPSKKVGHKGQSARASSAKAKLETGQYSVLGEIDEEKTAPSQGQMDHEGPKLNSPTVDLTTAMEAAVKGRARSSPLTSEDKLRKTVGQQRGIAPVLTVPVLLTLKRNERTDLRKRIVRTHTKTATALPMGARSTTIPADLAELEIQLGVRSAVTPSTGNCLAMAIAQAVSDANLEAPDRALELVTSSIKRGIKYTGLLALEGQFAHDHRVHLLKNVGRGWPGMSRTESASQVRWYLEDYAASSSVRTETVPLDVWGTSDSVGMAANFLQQTIYVIQRVDGQSQGWRCVKYVPTTVTRHNCVTETAEEHPLSLLTLIDEAVAAKIETPDRPPLILQYQDRHYSAFLHSGRTCRLPEFESEQDLIESIGQDITEHSDHTMTAPTGVTEDKPPTASMAESAKLCNAPHEPDRTAPTDSGTSTEYGQELAVVERRMVLPALPLTPPRGPRQAPPPDRKRGISTSPEKDQSTGAIVPYQANATVHKKGRVDTAPPRSTSGDEDYERIDRGDWASAWELLESNWPNPKQIAFPTADSSMAEWQHAARHAPDHLLWLVKRFVFPGELLQILDVSVIVLWMAESRRACVEASLRRYRATPLDQLTQAWLDRWLEKTRHHGHSVLAPLMDSSDDWNKLEAKNYAGDDLLRLCDPRRRTRLSHHLLCALLYDHGIAALVEGVPSSQGVPEKIRAHMQLILTNTRYKEAYYTSTQLADWAAIERFFYAGLARPTMDDHTSY